RPAPGCRGLRGCATTLYRRAVRPVSWVLSGRGPGVVRSERDVSDGVGPHTTALRPSKLPRPLRIPRSRSCPRLLGCSGPRQSAGTEVGTGEAGEPHQPEGPQATDDEQDELPEAGAVGRQVVGVEHREAQGQGQGGTGDDAGRGAYPCAGG